MLKTQGMLHFSLAVTDLDRSRQFYEGVLNLKVVEQSPRMVFSRPRRLLDPRQGERTAQIRHQQKPRCITRSG
jgi:catechol 2,3-dioxygenase-like lactoylglutathione lyase family enzyme